jgi:predicted methyltransferase
MREYIKPLLLGLTLLGTTSAFADPLTEAISHQDRPNEHKVRDEYRNPQQTLRFFGLQPNMSVVEISPGGGWYTNILAPIVKESGKLYAAHFYIEEGTSDYFKNARKAFEEKVQNHPPYKNIKVTSFHPIKALEVAPANSTDMVLTFRNIHNWYMRQGDEGVKNAFTAFFNALKKGGVLGVVEHRLPENLADDMQKTSGYMKQSYVIKMAEAAGFTLALSSEVNANPLDSAQHPRGVWTLPPRLRLGDEDKEKYLAIGESDRMTLKFIKP